MSVVQSMRYEEKPCSPPPFIIYLLKGPFLHPRLRWLRGRVTLLYNLRRRTALTHLVIVFLPSPAAGWTRGPPWRRWGDKARSDYRNNTSSSVWSWWWRWCPGRAQDNTHRSPHFSWQEHLVRSGQFEDVRMWGCEGVRHTMSNLPITSHSPFWTKVLISPPSSESNFKSNWKYFRGKKWIYIIDLLEALMKGIPREKQ